MEANQVTAAVLNAESQIEETQTVLLTKTTKNSKEHAAVSALISHYSNASEDKDETATIQEESEDFFLN